MTARLIIGMIMASVLSVSAGPAVLRHGLVVSGAVDVVGGPIRVNGTGIEYSVESDPIALPVAVSASELAAAALSRTTTAGQAVSGLTRFPVIAGPQGTNTYPQVYTNPRALNLYLSGGIPYTNGPPASRASVVVSDSWFEVWSTNGIRSQPAEAGEASKWLVIQGADGDSGGEPGGSILLRPGVGMGADNGTLIVSNGIYYGDGRGITNLGDQAAGGNLTVSGSLIVTNSSNGGSVVLFPGAASAVYITTPGYSAVLYPAAQVFVATNYASTLTLGTGSAYPAGAFVFSGGPLYGNAVGLTNFPGSLQTVSSAQANFWRRTSTQPESWDDAGLEGQMTITPRDGTSRWVNVHDGTNWFRFQASWF